MACGKASAPSNTGSPTLPPPAPPEIFSTTARALGTTTRLRSPRCTFVRKLEPSSLAGRIASKTDMLSNLGEKIAMAPKPHVSPSSRSSPHLPVCHPTSVPPIITRGGSARTEGGETTEVAGSTHPSPRTADPHKRGAERRRDPCRRGRGRRIHPSRRRRQRIRARGASGGGVQAEEPRIHLNVRVQIARVEACRLQRAHEVSHLLAGVTVPRNKTTTSQNPSRRVISSGDMAKYPIHRPPATRRWLHG